MEGAKILTPRVARNEYGKRIYTLLPTLKYYLRLLRRPEAFVAVYSKCLQDEFQRASGIKKEHLKIWSEIWQNLK